VKATFVDWLERFLRKRNRRKFVESDYVSIPGIRNDTDEIIYVSWSLEDMINQDLFVGLLYLVRQPRVSAKARLYRRAHTYGFEWVMERMRQAMFVVIPYRNMRSLMPKTLPTSQTGWTKLAKAVYTRSRTRGSIDPVASNIVIDYYNATKLRRARYHIVILNVKYNKCIVNYKPLGLGFSWVPF
jgi:hypothetical protein